MSCEVNFRKKGLFDVSFKFHFNFDDVISILQINLNLIIAFKFSCTPKLVTAVSMDIKLGTFPKFHWFYHNHAISILQTSFISFNQSCCLNLMTIVLTPWWRRVIAFYQKSCDLTMMRAFLNVTGMMVIMSKLGNITLNEREL